MKSHAGVWLGFVALLVAGSASATVRVASGLDLPVFLTAPPGDTARVFILEQHTGAIRILQLSDLTLLPDPFLVVPGVSTGGEQGLLGLAFDPNYAVTGFFYVVYTDPDIKVVRYRRSPLHPNVAVPSSASPILSIAHPADNHNGGWIGFDANGYLYLATGDGGGVHDDGPGHTPAIGNAQDLTDNLLGKILRIDVNGDDFPGDPLRNYAIPPTNPFVGIEGDDEIWAYGLRNPWRPSFDRQTGALYVADVGQDSCEEINVQPWNTAGGLNYGWRLREGLIQEPFPGVGGPKPPGAVDPILNYPHPGASCVGPDHGAAFIGFVIVGGYVYRGPAPALRGRYFFTDNLVSHLWSLVWDGTPPALADGTNFTGLTDHSTDPAWAPDVGAMNSVASFGEDAAGNLYALDLDGEVFRLPEPVGWAPLAIGLAGLLVLPRARRT